MSDCTCGNGEAEEDRGAVLRCPVHRPVPAEEPWPDESGVESAPLAAYPRPSPAQRDYRAGLSEEQVAALIVAAEHYQEKIAWNIPLSEALAHLASGPSQEGEQG